MRPSGRELNQMREVSIETNVTKHAEGSCLIKMGDTHVLCTASLEDRVPPFIRGTGLGWVTAEYGMLPRSTSSRMRREAASGKQGGRTVEIQRLIGRSLRAGVDRVALDERQITVDCDVLQADGEKVSLPCVAKIADSCAAFSAPPRPMTNQATLSISPDPSAATARVSGTTLSDELLHDLIDKRLT